jgi:hypothetical protein
MTPSTRAFICIRLNGRQVALIKKLLYMKMVSGIFVLRGTTETRLVLNVFVGLPEQLLRMKSLLKLLEITEKCKMCNGCGNSKEYENLSSETSIFKKKEGREGVLHENNLLRSADCSILLKHDEPDKCVHPVKIATIACEQLCPGRKMPIKIRLNQHDLITEARRNLLLQHEIRVRLLKNSKSS